jgi:hypothetical protein
VPKSSGTPTTDHLEHLLGVETQHVVNEVLGCRIALQMGFIE